MAASDISPAQKPVEDPPRTASSATSAVAWAAALVRVGGGRGFVVEPQEERRRLVITAAHCLPRRRLYPYPAADHERTYQVLGPLGRKRRTVWAECLFVDYAGDIAILGQPDNQALPNEADAYDALVEAAVPLAISDLLRRREIRPPIVHDGVSYQAKVLVPCCGHGWLMALDGMRFRCLLHHHRGHLAILKAARDIEGGMSGSPIIADDGTAVGILCAAGRTSQTHQREGGGPQLADHLPGWLLPISACSSLGRLRLQPRHCQRSKPSSWDRRHAGRPPDVFDDTYALARRVNAAGRRMDGC